MTDNGGKERSFFAEIGGELGRDLGYALRQLRTAPAFSLVAILTLALGVGASTAIFSALHAVLLDPLPLPQPERLVRVATALDGAPTGTSPGEFGAWRDMESLERVAAFDPRDLTLDLGDRRERIAGAHVSASFFDLLSLPPVLGRVFSDREMAEKVAVLGHSLWARRFGGDSDVLGRTLELDGESYEVIGVMPPETGVVPRAGELWVPLDLSSSQLANSFDGGYLGVVARIAEGFTEADVRAELGAVSQVLGEHPDYGEGMSAAVEPLLDHLVGDHRSRLLVLFGAVAFVLLIACSNVAHLLLARGAVRRKEIAIRSALGAGRGRVVRQLLTESLVLALAGGVVALAIARGLLDLLVARAPTEVPRLAQAGLDGPVLLFALGVAVGGSLLAGLAPALSVSRSDVQSVLREGGRAARGFAWGASRGRLRSGLVAAEVAMALVLLVAAGLLIRTARALETVSPGFDPHGVLTATVVLPDAAERSPEASLQVFLQAAGTARRLPGVTEAAVTAPVPFSGAGMSMTFRPEEALEDDRSEIQAGLQFVTPGYFRTLRIPHLAGRDFEPSDTVETPRVVIVNRTLAERLWPGEDPLGRRITAFGSQPGAPVWQTVVGVVGDVKSRHPSQPPEPQHYLPIAQTPESFWTWGIDLFVVARTATEPGGLAEPLRRALEEVDPSLTVFNAQPMEDRLAGSIATTRFLTLLLTVLGVLGLALAAVGIYGVIAYFVRQRTHEIGVRMALGASQRQVLGLAFRQAVGPVGLGVALGTVLALAASRFLGSQLYGVPSTDPGTYLAVAGVLMAVVGLAVALPAQRALRIEPVRALAEE